MHELAQHHILLLYNCDKFKLSFVEIDRARSAATELCMRIALYGCTYRSGCLEDNLLKFLMMLLQITCITREFKLVTSCELDAQGECTFEPFFMTSSAALQCVSSTDASTERRSNTNCTHMVSRQCVFACEPLKGAAEWTHTST